MCTVGPSAHRSALARPRLVVPLGEPGIQRRGPRRRCLGIAPSRRDLHHVHLATTAKCSQHGKTADHVSNPGPRRVALLCSSQSQRISRHRWFSFRRWKRRMDTAPCRCRRSGGRLPLRDGWWPRPVAALQPRAIFKPTKRSRGKALPPQATLAERGPLPLPESRWAARHLAVAARPDPKGRSRCVRSFDQHAWVRRSARPGVYTKRATPCTVRQGQALQRRAQRSAATLWLSPTVSPRTAFARSDPCLVPCQSHHQTTRTSWFLSWLALSCRCLCSSREAWSCPPCPSWCPWCLASDQVSDPASTSHQALWAWGPWAA